MGDYFPVGDRGPGSSAQEIIEVNAEEMREKREKENRKKLTALLEKIEGCSVSWLLFIHFIHFHFRLLLHLDPSRA